MGLGKTIEAGLVLRELKLRGRAKRILVVAPKGLVRQWQAEMRQHFGEPIRHGGIDLKRRLIGPWREANAACM